MIILIPVFILLLILIGLIIFILKVFKRHGYNNIGIGISIIIVIGFLSIPFTFIFDGLFFSKSDATVVLLDNEVVLDDDFKFESKSISGIMDYILEFELKISESDKNRIINNINSSVHRVENRNFQMSNLYSRIPTVLEKDTILYATYETENHWNIERIHVLKNRYVLTSDIIQISKSENNLRMIRHQ